MLPAAQRFRDPHFATYPCNDQQSKSKPNTKTCCPNGSHRLFPYPSQPQHIGQVVGHLHKRGPNGRQSQPKQMTQDGPLRQISPTMLHTPTKILKKTGALRLSCYFLSARRFTLG